MADYGTLGRRMGGSLGAMLAGSPSARMSGEMAGLRQIAIEDAIAARQQEMAAKSPQATVGRVLSGLGIGAENAPDALNWVHTGKIGRFDPSAGPAEPAPSWYTPDVKTEIGRRFAASQAVQAGEAKSLSDYFEGQTQAGLQTSIAKALAGDDMVKLAQLQNKDPTKQVESLLADAIRTGALTPQAGGARMAATMGRPLYTSDATGMVLDQFGGGTDTANPMASAAIALRNQQAAQARAAAAENYAQAGAASATAGLRKAQTGAVGAIGGAPGGRVPVGYRWASDLNTGEPVLEPIPGGPKDPNAQTGKPLPASAANGLLENQTNVRRAETALALAEGKNVGDAKGDKEATGLKGWLPDQVLNRVDPKGTDTRAAIADLGSLVIHDRSGAAVTAAEFPRLAPFIPTPKDDQATVQKKLRNFVRVYKEETGQAVDFFRASGYNVPADTLKGADVEGTARPAQAAGGPYADAEKERRYQEWKARQGSK